MPEIYYDQCVGYRWRTDTAQSPEGCGWLTENAALDDYRQYLTALENVYECFEEMGLV